MPIAEINSILKERLKQCVRFLKLYTFMMEMYIIVSRLYNILLVSWIQFSYYSSIAVCSFICQVALATWRLKRSQQC